jgi:hypothetical protein
MNVTIKLDDALCREARHQAVDADLSLSGWISALIHERLGKTSVSRVKEASLLDLLGAEEAGAVDFAVPKWTELARPADLED